MKYQTIQRGLLLLFITTAPLTMGAEENADRIIRDLRDVVFQQDLNDSEIRDYYLELKDDLSRLDMSIAETFYYNSNIEYWMGRAYQSFDETNTVVEHHKMIQRGKFLKLRNFYTALDDAVYHYEISLSNIDKYLELNPDSEGYRLYSEIQGQLILLKPVSYVLANGMSVKRTLKKSLRLDPSNVKALIADGASDIYTPPRYGGDQELGISALKQALGMDDADREDRFNICTGIAYGLIVLERHSEALEWLDRAAEIYPGNIYLSGLRTIAREGI